MTAVIRKGLEYIKVFPNLTHWKKYIDFLYLSPSSPSQVQFPQSFQSSFWTEKEKNLVHRWLYDVLHLPIEIKINLGTPKEYIISTQECGIQQTMMDFTILILNKDF